MKVIVIGGGIGGLAVATGLRRAGHLVIVRGKAMAHPVIPNATARKRN
jgi:2-polyprenyl-6-methoxyphenol hydroxylase-like FAD-dependent oxidoreductase